MSYESDPNRRFHNPGESDPNQSNSGNPMEPDSSKEGDGSWLLDGETQGGSPSMDANVPHSGPPEPIGGQDDSWLLDDSSESNTSDGSQPVQGFDAGNFGAGMGSEEPTYEQSTIDESDEEIANSTLAASYCEPESPKAVLSRLMMPAVFVAAISVGGLILWKSINASDSGESNESAAIVQTEPMPDTSTELAGPDLGVTSDSELAGGPSIRGQIQRDGSVRVPNARGSSQANRPGGSGFTPSVQGGHKDISANTGPHAPHDSEGDWSPLTPEASEVVNELVQDELVQDVTSESDSSVAQDGGAPILLGGLAMSFPDAENLPWHMTADFKGTPGQEDAPKQWALLGSVLGDWVLAQAQDEAQDTSVAMGPDSEDSGEALDALANLEDTQELPFFWPEEEETLETNDPIAMVEDLGQETEFAQEIAGVTTENLAEEFTETLSMDIPGEMDSIDMQPLDSEWDSMDSGDEGLAQANPINPFESPSAEETQEWPIDLGMPTQTGTVESEEVSAEVAMEGTPEGETEVALAGDDNWTPIPLWLPLPGGGLRMQSSGNQPWSIQEPMVESEEGLALAEEPQGLDSGVTDRVEMIVVEPGPLSGDFDEQGQWRLGDGATEVVLQTEDSTDVEPLVEAPVFEVLPLIEYGNKGVVDEPLAQANTPDQPWMVHGPFSIEPQLSGAVDWFQLPDGENAPEAMVDEMSIEIPTEVEIAMEGPSDMESTELVTSELETSEVIPETNPELITAMVDEMIEETIQDEQPQAADDGELAVQTGTSQITRSSVQAPTPVSVSTALPEMQQPEPFVMDEEDSGLLAAYREWNRMDDQDQLEESTRLEWLGVQRGGSETSPFIMAQGSDTHQDAQATGSVAEVRESNQPQVQEARVGVLRRRVLEDNHWSGTEVPMHALHAEEVLLTPRVGPVRVVALEGETIEGRLHGMGQGYVWMENNLGRMTVPARRVERIERIDPGQYRDHQKSAMDFTKLPKVRVKAPGGTFVGYQLTRDGNRITIRTEKGHKMTLVSDEITTASSFRPVGIKRTTE